MRQHLAILLKGSLQRVHARQPFAMLVLQPVGHAALGCDLGRDLRPPRVVGPGGVLPALVGQPCEAPLFLFGLLLLAAQVAQPGLDPVAALFGAL